MPEGLQRDVIRHGVEIDVLNREMSRLTKAVDGLTDQMRQLERTMHQAQGGWRMLLILGGMAAAIGSLLREIIGWFIQLTH